MKNFRKTKAATALAIIAAIVTAGGAYAFWTSTGSGSGSAKNAAGNGTTTIKATFASGLTPGATEDVVYTADNPGSSKLQVGTIKAVVSTLPTTCLPADFVVPDFPANKTVPAGTTGFALGSGKITFTDTDVNQDACKSATVTLTVTSN